MSIVNGNMPPEESSGSPHVMRQVRCRLLQGRRHRNDDSRWCAMPRTSLARGESSREVPSAHRTSRAKKREQIGQPGVGGLLRAIQTTYPKGDFALRGGPRFQRSFGLLAGEACTFPCGGDDHFLFGFGEVISDNPCWNYSPSGDTLNSGMRLHLGIGVPNHAERLVRSQYLLVSARWRAATRRPTPLKKNSIAPSGSRYETTE